MQPRVHDPEGAASFADDQQDFGGQAREFRVTADRGRALAVGRDPRIYEGLPARYGGPIRRSAPSRAARVQAAGRRHARTDRAAAQAVRRGAGGAREDSAERRARQHRRDRRARTRRPPARRARAARRSTSAATWTAGTQRRVRHAHRDAAWRGARSAGRSPPREVDRIRRARAQVAGAARTRSRKGSRSGSRRCWCRPTSCSASSAIGRADGRVAARSRSASTSWRRGCRTSSGRACRTPSCGARPTRHAAQPAVLDGAGAAHAARSEGARAGGALRRPVAAVPRARIGRPATASGSRTSTTTCASRCAARPSCSSSTSSARTAASSTSSTAEYTFLNERLARHYGIAGVSGPEFRRVDLTRHAARRRADAGAAC